jgi:MFS transporter, CP family, cyanate transporter
MSGRNVLLAVTLLWLSGIALRATILAVPPVIPLLQRDLHMSGTEVGALSGLPTIMIGIAAMIGAIAIPRFGALATLVGGLIVTAVGTALRGAAINVPILFATTIVMSAGVAIAQPTLPVLVRQWLPGRIGLGTATCSNGLIVGGIVPIALMLPVIMPIFDNSWRSALAVWALPVLAIAALVMLIAPRSPSTDLLRPPAEDRRWSSLDYNLLWRIGLIFGGNNSIFFGTNAFLPGYLSSAGRHDLISVALTAYNFGQLPSSLLIIALAHRIEGRKWPYLAAGAVAIASIGAMISTANDWIVAATAMLGFASGATLALGLALPPLLARPEQVGRMSAMMFVLSYTYAMIVALCGGVAWDLTGRVSAAFILIAASVVPLMVLVPTIRFSDSRSD